MRRGSVIAAMKSTVFLGAIIFLFSVVFPPFDDLTAVDLSVHMLQHVIIVLSGVMIAYPLYRRGTLPSTWPPWTPRIVVIGCAVALVYWHLPGPWDFAVLNPLFHSLEHLTFLLIGIAIGSVLQALSTSAKIAGLFAIFFSHMLYAVILVSSWSNQVYPLYSIGDQATLGWILLLTGWSFLVEVAYILNRNPGWLAGFRGEGQEPHPEPKKSGGSHYRTGPITLAASLLLIVVLLGYFATSAAAVYSAPRGGSSPRVTTVYIAETPVSWQYLPQNVTVVLGVNSTVTWISHSIAYDTITEDSGVFKSGAIAPGGSFTYSFTKPGVYPYRCDFHPWMTGTVTVLAG
jgi:plastocyanin